MLRPSKRGLRNDTLVYTYENGIDKDLLNKSVLAGQRVYRATKIQLSHVAALYYIANKAGHHEKMQAFCDDLVKGYGPTQRSPVRFALEIMQKLRASENTITMEQSSLVLLRSWAAYRDGKKTTPKDRTLRSTDPFVPIKGAK